MKARSTFLILAFTLLLVVSQTATAQSIKSTCCDFRSDMRKLWEDHITWTRIVILNVIDDLPGTTEAVNRLLKNQEEIGNAIKYYYGEAAGNQLTTLLKEHITIAADLLTALKSGNTAAFTKANTQWINNADAIAAFLSAANPNWPLPEMKTMMRGHLALTVAEALARKNADYAGDVAAYEKVHLAILEMADMLTEGIIRQFPNKFKGCAGGKTINTMKHTSPSVSLGQNVPNPFTSKTDITYYVAPAVHHAQIMVYDQMGNAVQKLDIRTRGEGHLTLHAAGLKKGIYKYSIIADGMVMDTKTLIH